MSVWIPNFWCCFLFAGGADMTKTISFEMHRYYRETNDRFDQFVLAALLAVCAYLGQTNPYARLGLNFETLHFLSLVFFVASAICAFKRIEFVIVGYRCNHDLLVAREGLDHGKAEVIIVGLELVKKRAERYYKIRNYLLFFGFGFYVLAKYWAVYAV